MLIDNISYILYIYIFILYLCIDKKSSIKYKYYKEVLDYVIMLKRAFLEVGMNNDTILLENISKSFGEHQIIEDLNIEMTRGEIVSFIGANGTGKSTK